MGAWIEISPPIPLIRYFSSLPLWERGLKLDDTNIVEIVKASLPLWERGLKCGNRQDTWG